MVKPEMHSPTPAVGPFSGVFSEKVSHSLGFGSTKRRQEAKTYWLIERTAADEFFIQSLNKNMIPVGDKKRLDRDKFLSDFCPEPDLFMGVTKPRMHQMEEAIRRGDEHREQEELFSAEVEYKRALQINEDEIRANFGLGLTYLARGDTQKASYVFNRLVAMEAAYQSAHKHLFNEFGIALRKGRMLKEAVTYYSRALTLAEDDDHLLYNLARVHLELRNLAQAHSLAQRALGINPDLIEAQQILQILVRADPSLATAGISLSELGARTDAV
jgi:tetratricopeptide (TPR) repeat protein